MKRLIAFAVALALFGIGIGADVSAAQKEITFLDVAMGVGQLAYVKTFVIPEFEAKFKAKVNVISTTWNERMDKISVLHAAGTPPDVVVKAFYSQYEEGSRGMLEPLDKYVARWDNFKKYPKPLMDAQRWDGKLLAIPNNIDFRILAYNKELFAESGFDPERPPQSWDEQYQYAKRLTRLEGDRVGVRGIDLLGNISTQRFDWFLRQTGMTEINTNTFTPNLNTREAIDTLQHLLNLYDASQSKTPCLGGYAQGRAAIWFAPPYISSTLKRSSPEMLPVLGAFSPRRYVDSKPVAHAFINGLAIMAASKEKDLAWEFIALMNSDEHLIKLQELGGWIAGRVDLVRRMMDIQPRIELWYSQFDYLEASLIPPPRNTAQNSFDTLLTQAYNMKISPQAALEQAQTVWQRLLNEWKAEINRIK